MLIDAHTHILSLAEDAEFTTEYGREGSLCIYRSLGLLPSHRDPTEQEWEASGYARKGFPVIGPEESIRDHPGFDRIVVLGVSPQFLNGELIGTVDSFGITDVPGPSTPEKCNDYIAAVVRTNPDVFIGFGSVNPNYRGVKAAVTELERMVTELGLTGLKLYPMYQHWSPADPVLAFPIFDKAEQLGIPVLVHQAGSTRVDARMEHANPALLDPAGRHFPDMRLILAHCGLPWVDEALFMLTKHPNFYTELSYHIATVTREELYRFLIHAKQFFVPLEKIFFGSDYPGFLYDPVDLMTKLRTVNEEADRLGTARIPQEAIDGICGDNFARLLGLMP
ncbi:MAG: amidohydrolase family protein [Actinomycetes bacterium]|jgi:predicted TIM-barrel fold metal-dependent hydrolase